MCRSRAPGTPAPSRRVATRLDRPTASPLPIVVEHRGEHRHGADPIGFRMIASVRYPERPTYQEAPP